MVFPSFIDIISVTVGVIAIYEFLIKRKLRECKIIIILYNITYYLNISENEESYEFSKEKIKEYTKKFNYYYNRYDHIKHFVKKIGFPEMESLSTDKDFSSFFKNMSPVNILDFINIYSFNDKFGVTPILSYFLNKIILIISRILEFSLIFLGGILVLIKDIAYTFYSSKKEAFIFIIYFISSIYIISDFFNVFYSILDFIIGAISYITGPIAGDGL